MILACCSRRPLLTGLAMCVAFAVTACGHGKSRDPESMCKSIFTERTTGIIKPFRDNGPRNEAAFMKLCTTLPHDYLACELEEANRQTATCARMLRESPHARRLNAVLVSGHAGNRVRSASDTANASANAGANASANDAGPLAGKH